MTRIQNVLVGVDLHHDDRLASSELGEESQAAVEEAMRLATAIGGDLTFCSVLEISAQSQTLIEHDRDQLIKTVEDIARDALNRIVEQANSRGIPSESVIRFGKAWEELAKESATGTYDLAIIGTRNKLRASAIWFGNTAQKLMRFAACPVWVVKPSELRDIREVVIATDLSPASLPALNLAVTIARAIQAKLHVLHVLEEGEFRYLMLAGIAEEEIFRAKASMRQAAEEQLRDQLQRTDFRTLPHGVKIELQNGNPDSVIPQFVIENDIDLLVIGTHGHSGITGLLLGNTAERILPKLHASLLAVKPIEFQSPYQPTDS